MNIKYSFCISLDITPAGEARLGWAGVQRGDDAFTAIKCEGLEQRNWFHNLLTTSWPYFGVKLRKKIANSYLKVT